MKRSNNHLVCGCGKHLSRQDASIIGSNKRFLVICKTCKQELLNRAQYRIREHYISDLDYNNFKRMLKLESITKVVI